MPTGLMLILSAPSGAGKTTLAHLLLEAHGAEALFSVSYTTRPPRGRERDGVDYHFVDEAAFQKMIEGGLLLEWAQVHGNCYGSHRRYAAEAQAGRLVVFDIDVQGGTAIKAKHPEAVSVFILPPSMDELERRLRERKTDTEEVIGKRLRVAREEIARGCASYDYILVNDDLPKAYTTLESIVTAERCRRGRIDLGSLGLADGTFPGSKAGT